MKKIILFLAVFLLVSVFAISAATSIRVGKIAVSAHFVLGKNNEDSIAQVGTGVEYGIINHFSAGIGYVYVDGMHPLQAHGLDLFVKGYVLDSFLDLHGFDLFGEAGTQVYFKDGIGLTYTFLTGLEWQSPFKFMIALKGGTELENGSWGYLSGVVLGYRF